MADSSIPASAQAGRRELTTTPDANRNTNTEASDVLSTETASNPPMTLRQALQKSDVDVPHEHWFERHQTFDSISSLSNRTNTFASIKSATTDLTEPDHDPATLYDEEEGNASSLSRICRSNTLNFSSPPPSRTQSFNVVDHYDHPHPGHPADESDVEIATRQLAQLRVRDRDHSALPGRPGSGAQSSPSSTIHEVDEPEDIPTNPEPQTQGQTTTSQAHSDDMSTADDVDNWTPEETSDEHSEGLGGSDSSSSKLDNEIVRDAYSMLLKHVFGLELQDLAATDADSEAYSSVRNCLEELSRILASSLEFPTSPALQVMAKSGESGTGGSPFGSNRPSPQGGQGAGNVNGGGGQKRRQDDGDSPGGEGHDDGNCPGGSGGGGVKRPRAESSGRNGDLNLSCPFRKRNPVKFNIRDFQSCAVQSFPDISQLKRHVKLCHKQKVVSTFACPRCKIDMETNERLDNHLRAPSDQICEPHEAPLSQDPEDGITGKVEDVLNGRRANTKVDSWKILWSTLFPNDRPEDIRSAEFVPPIEFDEVYAEFQAQRWHDVLKERVAEEERSASSSDEDIDVHIAKMVDICEEYIDYVFDAYRRQKIGNHPIQRRRRRGAGAGLGAGTQKSSVSPNPTERSQSALNPLTPNLGLRIAVSNGSSPHSSPHDTGSGSGSWLGSHPPSQVEDMTTPTAPSSQFEFQTVAAYSGLGLTNNGMNGNLPRRTRPYASSPVDGLGFQEETHHSRIPSDDSGVSFNGMSFPNGNVYQQPTMFGQQSQAPFQQGGFTGPMMGPDQASPFPMTGPMTTMAGPGAISGQVLAFTQQIGSNGFGFPPQSGFDRRNDHLG